MPVWDNSNFTSSGRSSKDLGSVPQQRTDISGFSTRGLVIVTIVIPAIFALISMIGGMK